MPIITSGNKFPPLSRPFSSDRWQDWAERTVSVLENFFETDPYGETYPIAAFADGELVFAFSSSGSAATSIQSVTIESDGRPLAMIAHAFVSAVNSATASSTVTLAIDRRGSAGVVTVARLDNTMDGVKLPEGFLSLAATDTPAQGKYIYSFRISVVNSTSNSHDFRFRNRFMVVFDKPNK